MKENPGSYCGDVFGYGSGFALGAAIGGFIGTSAFAFGSGDSGSSISAGGGGGGGSGGVVLALLLLAGHVGGSLRVADSVYRRQKEEVVSRVNKM